MNPVSTYENRPEQTFREPLQSRPLGSSGRPPSQPAACQKQNVGRMERWISMLAGAGLVGYGLSSGRRGSVLATLFGGGLVYRGATGHCQGYEMLGVSTAETSPATAVPAKHGCKVERTVTINRSPSELYSFWREIENLPKIMKHLKTVESIDRQRSHWVAEGALGKTVEWDAEVFNDVENELIAWRSLPGSDVDTAGSVRFKKLNHDRGTEVTVSLKYDPPAGKLGAWIASLAGSGAEQKIADDLRAFKQVMEAGETPTIVNQSDGRR